MKAFHVWRFKGRNYLAIPRYDSDHSFMILDEEGGNFGSWQTVESFRKRQQSGDPNGQLSLPDCEIALRYRVISGVEYR